jgi:hypothetical protein
VDDNVIFIVSTSTHEGTFTLDLKYNNTMINGPEFILELTEAGVGGDPKKSMYSFEVNLYSKPTNPENSITFKFTSDTPQSVCVKQSLIGPLTDCLDKFPGIPMNVTYTPKDRNNKFAKHIKSKGLSIANDIAGCIFKCSREDVD